ncbi:MAG TPA: DUF3048 domain-containing protein [Candidatus Limnocylindrales bacterium]
MIVRRPVAGALALVVIGIGVAIGGAFSALSNSSAPRGASSPTLLASPTGGTPLSSGGPSPSPLAGTGPSANPGPSPSPGPILVAAPLDGLLVSPAAAARHPIACMIDDLSAARPQSGFSDASVVWQAPAEGGIPRYMTVFQERVPKAVGPVRSARYYYIAWAAEWRAVYCHAGGSPQALETLRAKGNGQLVFNADQFFNDPYFWRISSRLPPHNLYTDGPHLEALARRVGGTAPPGKAVWRFAPDAPLAERPNGGRIDVAYLANRITYRYDRATNTYRRYVSGGVRQVDAGTGKAVAPRNVVIMRMQFGPLNDGHPQKHRLEAKVVGSGIAWIATNGHTIRGTWRKRSLTAPTLFYDAAGRPVTLTAGQTFVQVMKTTDFVSIKDGRVPPIPPTTQHGSIPE